MFVNGDWAGALDEVWPTRHRVGRGSATLVAGWIFHRRSPVVALELTVGQSAVPVRAFGMPRLDVHARLAHANDEPPTAAYTCGFWSVVPLAGVDHSEATPCTLRARTASGASWHVKLPTLVRAAANHGPTAPRDPGRVSICMATYEPDLELFRRQICSLHAQTYTNWSCVIVDDASRPEVADAIAQTIADDDRFVVHREARRLGSYFNFERALMRAAPDAGLVALADQDDVWHPDKLATLVDALGPTDLLVYSDQRLVRPDGNVVSDTFWTGRENQWRDLGSLLRSNTVTGAASLFRRSLVDRALPFPARLPPMHHDHWLALVARVTGSIAYVDRALYDYVQHPGQLVGHAAGSMRAAMEVDVSEPSKEREILLRWQRHYFERLLPAQLMATALLERFRNIDTRDRVTLQRAAAGDGSWRGWWALLSAAADRRRGPTLGYGRDAALGAFWRRVAPLRARQRSSPAEDGRHTVWTPSYSVDYGPDIG